jgi:hypothetical protein
MPKEVIDCSKSDERSYVQVGWDRSGSVQLATMRCEPSNSEDGTLTDAGMFVDLHRVQINDLIRQLRRARDAAFGRDE